MVFDTVLAIALITTPVPSGQSIEHLQSTWYSVRTIAEELEIMDPREGLHTVGSSDLFREDIGTLHERWLELANLPRIDTASRFPSYYAAREAIDCNLDYQKLLMRRMEISSIRDRVVLQRVMDETVALYEVWDAVSDAQSPYLYRHIRKNALQKIRTLIGEAAYHDGALPPSIPLWRFARIP